MRSHGLSGAVQRPVCLPGVRFGASSRAARCTVLKITGALGPDVRVSFGFSRLTDHVFGVCSLRAPASPTSWRTAWCTLRVQLLVQSGRGVPSRCHSAWEASPSNRYLSCVLGGGVVIESSLLSHLHLSAFVSRRDDESAKVVAFAYYRVHPTAPTLGRFLRCVLSVGLPRCPLRPIRLFRPFSLRSKCREFSLIDRAAPHPKGLASLLRCGSVSKYAALASIHPPC